jgi:hypothetical protein
MGHILQPEWALVNSTMSTVAPARGRFIVRVYKIGLLVTQVKSG